MTKLKAFGIALLLAVLTLGGAVYTIENYYRVNDNSVRYNTSYEKYKSYDILTKNINDKSLVVMGSSELEATSRMAYHPKTRFNYGDFSIMQIGGEYYQNAVLAATLGSIGNDIPNKKVVMVESMQWFDPIGMRKEAFVQRISVEHVYNTMKNPKITQETKTKFINRMIQLADGDAHLSKQFKKFKQEFVEGQVNAVTSWITQANVSLEAMKVKTRFFMGQQLTSLPLNGPTTPDYNWEQLRAEGLENAKQESTNNDYGIYNGFYNYYIAGKLDQLKDSGKGADYTQSPEFEDLALYLAIAKDLGIEVRLVIFPVNGSWHDYIGVTQEIREAFYQKLRQIAKEHQVTLSDYTDHEYEKHFLLDHIHIGWGGWTDFEKELYEYFKTQ